MVSRSEEIMQAFNQELIQCIEDLKSTKASIEAQIEAEENEKVRLQREVDRMTTRINLLSESLSKKATARIDYERTIQETESAYMKILESSQLLLNMVKREAACLDQSLGNNNQNQCGGSDVEIAPRSRGSRDEEQAAACHKLAAALDHTRKRKNEISSKS